MSQKTIVISSRKGGFQIKPLDMGCMKQITHGRSPGHGAKGRKSVQSKVQSSVISSKILSHRNQPGGEMMHAPADRVTHIPLALPSSSAVKL